jgi:hypothetical protein
VLLGLFPRTRAHSQASTNIASAQSMCPSNLIQQATANVYPARPCARALLALWAVYTASSLARIRESSARSTDALGFGGRVPRVRILGDVSDGENPKLHA